MVNKKIKITSKEIVRIIFIIIMILFSFLPLVWMIAASLVPEDILYQSIIPISTNITLKHYNYVFSRTDFLKWYLNSLIVGFTNILITMPTATMMAYVATRFKQRYPWLKTFGPFALFLYMIPGIVLALPLVLIFGYLKLFDTLLGVAIANSTWSMPLSLWLLWGYFENIPPELEEAALVDGASRWKVLSRIIIPIARPGMAAVSIFSFLTVWLDYLFALTLIRSEVNYTASLGITWLIKEYSFAWGELTAAATLMAIPSTIIAFLSFKYLLYGFQMTLKGVR
ncbi:MAG: carbohydrate ABC transporter permease [Candidatus Methanomethylicaceae archaeon]